MVAAVKEKNVIKRFPPEEISAMVLGRLKAAAEVHFNAEVRNVVITVPAYFTDAQRQVGALSCAHERMDVHWLLFPAVKRLRPNQNVCSECPQHRRSLLQRSRSGCSLCVTSTPRWQLLPTHPARAAVNYA